MQVLEWVDDLLQQPVLSCLLGTIHTVSTHMPWNILTTRMWCMLIWQTSQKCGLILAQHALSQQGLPDLLTNEMSFICASTSG